MREGTLMSQRFDPDRLQLIGDPFRVADGIGSNASVNSNAGFSVSRNGILAYRGGTVADGNLLTWTDRTGKTIETVGDRDNYEGPVLSPDLQRLAVFKSGDIWIRDLARGTETRFTVDPAADNAPVWSPDGKSIVFQSTRSFPGDLYIKDAGGGAPEQPLLQSDHAKMPEDWSLDGRFLLYRDADPKSRADLWVLPMTGDRKPQSFLQTEFAETQGRFSPDGHWIAYVSNISGQPEVYVQSFPVSNTKYPISSGPAIAPRWRRDGKELFFISGQGAVRDIMAVDVTIPKDGTFKAGVPHKLFSAVFSGNIQRSGWAVTPDGQRFLLNVFPQSGIGSPLSTPITVVVNWLSRAQ
jgi:Tol biopolymer transport system component